MTTVLLMALYFAVVVLLPSAITGAIAATVVGGGRWRRGAGLRCGAVGGTIGVVLYKLYERSLPYENRRIGGWPVHHIIDPPSWYVVWLSMIGGSLIFSILCTAVFVKRPTTPASKEPSQQGNMQDSRAEPGAPTELPHD